MSHNPALHRDPPADRAYPAETMAVAIPTDGANLNAVLYAAGGAGAHPTMVLLHGLPGNEQNVDLAQSARRAGWNVLTFHYRGSWGTPGVFSFSHCIEDAEAAVDWLCRWAMVADRIDARRLVLVGHSMGGYIAAHVAANRPQVAGLAMISPADIGSAFGLPPRQSAVSEVDRNMGTSAGLHILAGATPEELAAEASRSANAWRLENHADALSGRPVLLVTSDDGFAAGSEGLARALASSGSFNSIHLPTDHSYSGCRIALQIKVLEWLDAASHTSF